MERRGIGRKSTSVLGGFKNNFFKFNSLSGLWTTYLLQRRLNHFKGEDDETPHVLDTMASSSMLVGGKVASHTGQLPLGRGYGFTAAGHHMNEGTIFCSCTISGTVLWRV